MLCQRQIIRIYTQHIMRFACKICDKFLLYSEPIALQALKGFRLIDDRWQESALLLCLHYIILYCTVVYFSSVCIGRKVLLRDEKPYIYNYIIYTIFYLDDWRK